MSTLGRLAVCVAALSAGAALATPAAARINCVKGFQRVQGNLIATPYCQDQYLAQVARQHGFRASAARIRNDPNYKKELCRFVFNDIRVQTTCLNAGVPEHFGGGF
jgi:tRNA(Met) C34 N-acetyltransferase TmcA